MLCRKLTFTIRKQAALDKEIGNNILNTCAEKKEEFKFSIPALRPIIPTQAAVRKHRASNVIKLYESHR